MEKMKNLRIVLAQLRLFEKNASDSPLDLGVVNVSNSTNSEDEEKSGTST